MGRRVSRLVGRLLLCRVRLVLTSLLRECMG